MTEYSFSQHKHNYAVWTAARAVQRRFTSTAKIQKAINASDLQQFAESNDSITDADFEAFHRTCANQTIDALNAEGITNASYGRAAKIISIYLKTSVILPNLGKCKRSGIIHPPIDSILLNNLSEATNNKNIKSKPWTKLSESDYWALVAEIKAIPKLFNWTLEEYWQLEDE
jgi:hypothetical protein